MAQANDWFSSLPTSMHSSWLSNSCNHILIVATFDSSIYSNPLPHIPRCVLSS